MLIIILIKIHTIDRKLQKQKQQTLQPIKSGTLSLYLSVPVSVLIPFVVTPRPTTASRPSTPLNPSPLAPQIRLLLTTVCVYKLYLLTDLFTTYRRHDSTYDDAELFGLRQRVVFVLECRELAHLLRLRHVPDQLFHLSYFQLGLIHLQDPSLQLRVRHLD